MSEFARDLSPAALIRGIEENAAELLMAMGRAGGGEQREDSTVRWTIGGSPLDYHNCVVHARLDPADADSVIAESLERMRAFGVSGSWHVGPSMRPADLRDRLRAAGFAFGGSEAGMAADLHALQAEPPASAELTIERVRDIDELSTWAATLARGFGEGEREAHWVAGVYEQFGFQEASPWLHYLARLAGEPVGTSTMFLGAGVAGCYFVMTVPESRGQGIGAAVTLAGLHEARELGYRIGVLGSSVAGHSVYERIGFRDYCTIDMYEWAPSG